MTRSGELWGRAGLLMCALLATSGLIPPVPTQAQTLERPLRVEPSVGVSYFPAYVYEDPETQYWGVDIAARVRAATGPGVEAGYTFVPQQETTSHSAPGLHVLRVVAVQAIPVRGESPVTLLGGLGVAALVLRAQRIDGGDFPLCSEWAPRSGTRLAPMGTMGLAVYPSSRLELHGDARVFRPMGDAWRPDVDVGWVTELSAGVRVVIGG